MNTWAINILSVIVAVVVYLVLVATFTNTMAVTFVIVGSVALMWTIADAVKWLLEKGSK